MAKGPEARVKDQVKKILQERGAWYYMPIQNGMGVVGIPDFIGCYQGQFFAIETKAPGKLNTLTPNQLARIKEIGDAGGVTVVATDAESVKALLDSMDVYARMHEQTHVSPELAHKIRLFKNELVVNTGVCGFLDWMDRPHYYFEPTDA